MFKHCWKRNRRPVLCETFLFRTLAPWFLGKKLIWYRVHWIMSSYPLRVLSSSLFLCLVSFWREILVSLYSMFKYICKEWNAQYYCNTIMKIKSLLVCSTNPAFFPISKSSSIFLWVTTSIKLIYIWMFLAFVDPVQKVQLSTVGETSGQNYLTLWWTFWEFISELSKIF